MKVIYRQTSGQEPQAPGGDCVEFVFHGGGPCSDFKIVMQQAAASVTSLVSQEGIWRMSMSSCPRV